MRSGPTPYAGLIGALLCWGGLSAWASSDEQAPHAVEILSEPVTIDRIYKSMEGITNDEQFQLPAPRDRSELLWVTGGRVEILTGADGSRDTERLLCHSYLKFEDQFFKARRPEQPARQINPQGRLFTFVQGQPAIRLPQGFGIPVLSTELMEFEVMVINPREAAHPFTATPQGTFEYVRDADLKEPLKPLFMRIVGMKVPVAEGGAGPSAHCSEAGEAAVPAQSSLHKIHKNLDGGFEQIYHWMVPPGRHEYRYRLERTVLATMPFDTTVHYINAHLHPHGEFVELRDLTTGDTVFRSSATNDAERTGLLDLTHFSSEPGVMIYRNHQYEMVAGYHNTTDHDVDAMAILFVYLLDKTFERDHPALAHGI